jgi:hypothetical protein
VKPAKTGYSWPAFSVPAGMVTETTFEPGVWLANWVTLVTAWPPMSITSFTCVP